MDHTQAQGLYDPRHEHDACGMGFVVHIKGHKSHDIIRKGLDILRNLTHRGAVGADPLMGDGAGILIQIPDALYREDMTARDITLPPAGEYGVGMIFLPREPAARQACEQELERKVRAEGQVVLGWRDVRVDADMPMSPTVKESEPVIRQIFIGRGAEVMVPDALERKLYVIRKTSSHAIRALGLAYGKEYFVASMSTRTVVYKGLLLANQVGRYYLDLADPRTSSALALVHQRFSTNTFPAWQLAHPYRMIAHNGEINTVKGNVNWINARTKAIASPVLGDDLPKLWPLIYPGQSDTASFDNCLELLTMAGYPLAHAVMMMIPEAWERHALMDNNHRAFYEYHAALMEPWDGPAALAFTDGHQVGATLDRNGLRPARYVITDDDLVILSSEAGVLPIPQDRIVKKWRLQPGKMLLIDTEAGRIISDKEIKDQLANARPYKQWIERISVHLGDLPRPRPEAHDTSGLLERQQAFGYTIEDLKFQLLPMAINGQEANGSMGNDTPLEVLSNQDKPLYNYFRQSFAQVTNPAIDPIREHMVMSLTSFIGPKPNLLDINNTNPPLRLEVPQPVLGFDDMARLRKIRRYSRKRFRSHALDITYPAAWGRAGIEARMASLCAEAVDAIDKGHNILIVSDRRANDKRVAIPALLATSAIHQHLVARGLRTSTGLVVETGSAREVHHFALLAGYGAEAVHPYLAMQTLAEHFADAPDGVTADKAIANYVKAINKGLQKVMSKMGISTYMSYLGAQIFEAVGLSRELVDTYFTGTRSNIEGIGLFEVADEVLHLHAAAYGEDPVLAETLPDGGDYAWRVRGEEHTWTPDAIAKLQHATRANNARTYAEYAGIINDQSRRHMTLRGLFAFRFDPTAAIPLDEVEPASEIVKRFATGAMSLGSISTEAHTTLAVAMNRIGGKSNTGEGGEDPARYRDELAGGTIKDGATLAGIIGKNRIERDLALQGGDSLRSRIKQVASGRFGVTAAYLCSADQIQIKVSQGAKPGEGGQLPGHKVSGYIAELRFSVPGVGLISPPPHHDIYSIEDLAQLIHDLKCCNPRARVHVKLVSEVGVGTVAAGVAKAHSDVVLISGHDGGTGASPLSSIKHAGTPWELGLAETQQTLIANKLRDRIVVQTDGQLKTGRDVVVAALLGAEEYGFATAPLVVSGCIMMRVCHLDTCPVGVATQNPTLRAKFSGKAEYVVNFFEFVAHEVREYLAGLGFRTLDEAIGHTEVLDTRPAIDHWKAAGLDLSPILHVPDRADSDVPRHRIVDQDHGLDKALDNTLIQLAEGALGEGTPVRLDLPVRNVNRTVGTMLGYELTRRWGGAGVADNTIDVTLTGSAGQSFGAFLPRGITLRLIGDANDYVGKGLSGGRITMRPHPDAQFSPEQNIIAGNVILYGATSGEMFLRGVVGERFCVRNSGALAVVEGVGDHGCEYMTGGRVVVLGPIGRNFAAGMSGGIAYVLDLASDPLKIGRVNQEMVDLDPLDDEDRALLADVVARHHAETGSAVARALLADWDTAVERFGKVMPKDYKRVLAAQAAAERDGRDVNEAIMEAAHG